MKKDIHPENYRLVAFKDMSNDDVFLTKSTADTKETLEVDGVEYPLVKLEISRTSHPFYTGKAKFLDTAGRIDKFKSKYDKFKRRLHQLLKKLLKSRRLLRRKKLLKLRPRTATKKNKSVTTHDFVLRLRYNGGVIF